MLRPMPIEPVPPETARVARAAFPKGHRDLRLADERETLFTDEAFLALFPPTDHPPSHLGSWRLSRFCHSPKGSPIAKRRMRCVAASIGQMSCAWNSRMPDSRPRCSASFAHVSSRVRLSISCSRPYDRGAATANWSTPEGASAPTRRISWRLSGP
jgi:hypothetical protein